MPDDELVAKYHENISDAMNREAAGRFLNATWRLDKPTDLRTLTTLWPIAPR